MGSNQLYLHVLPIVFVSILAYGAGMGEVVRHTTHLGRVCLPSTWSPELLRPGKGTKRRSNQVCDFVEYPRT